MNPLKPKDYIEDGESRERELEQERLGYAFEEARKQEDLYESFQQPKIYSIDYSGQVTMETASRIRKLRSQIADLGGDVEAGGYAQLPPVHLLSEEVGRRIVVYLREELGRELLKRRSQKGGGAGQV